MTGIVEKKEKFAIIDEEAYLNEIYNPSKLQIEPSLFEIQGPFKMDSQFEAEKNPNRRIRKRKRPINEYLAEKCTSLQSLQKEIQEAGTSAGHFKAIKEKDNNKSARNTASLIYRQAVPSCLYELDLEKKDKWWINSSNEFKTVSYDENSYIIPPECRFHTGDVKFLKEISDEFDLIVMDPPWLNRSVERTAGYKLSDSILYELEIKVLSKNGLLCMWLTNRKGIDEDCTAICQRWGLEVIAKWTWFKVTMEGIPVCDFNSGHKVPFENIAVCCFEEKIDEWKKKIPKEFTFVSIPMGVHSRKPPMELLLSIFGLSFSQKLELFARNLLPRTTSIGYEPLFLQNIVAFK